MGRIFITGASGFLGGHIYKLAQKDWTVKAGYFNNAPAQINDNWVKIDLTDSLEVTRTLYDLKPDVIIHAAANSNLDMCEQDLDIAHAVNVMTTENLMLVANELDSKLIFVSSDMVFDGKNGDYKESDPVAPISVYGRTKVLSEELLLKHCRNYVIARSALIYGKPVGGGTSFSEWIENKLKAGEPVSLFHDQFRTPVWVDNLAQALLELSVNDFTGVIHLGGSNRIDRYEFGLQLCDIAGYDRNLLKPISMHNFKPIAPRPVDVSLNIEKAQHILNTKMLSTFEGLSQQYTPKV